MDNDDAVQKEYTILQEIYTKGDDIQKLSVVQYLPQLLQIDAQATLNRILPKIQQELPNSSSEFHVATSRVFRQLIEQKTPANLLNAVIQGIESRDPIVAGSWVETLLGVIPFLNEIQIKKEVLPLAITKSQLNKPIFYRVASCNLLGKIAAQLKVDSTDVKKLILPIVQGLCQDTSFEVRASMCTQLSFIAEGLKDTQAVKSGLLPNLVELVKDDNPICRSSALVATVLILPLLPNDTKSETIVPLMKQFCSEPREENDISYPVLAREFGNMLVRVQPVLNANDALWFLKYFKVLSARGMVGGKGRGGTADPTQSVFCRQFCAQNLPQVTGFMVAKVPTQFDLWYSIFKDLAADPCFLVRKTVGGILHEVCAILGENSKMIKADVIRLLRDDAEEVLHSIVPNFGLVLEIFEKHGVLSKENTSQNTLEIGRGILKCQIELSRGHNWRMQVDLLGQMERLPNCVPSDFIHQHFTPVILTICVDGRAKPIRLAAARTVLVFLRYNTKEIQRKWIHENIINRLCNSKSCYTRDIFIRMCYQAMNIFSRKYFREYFFMPLINLMDDPVLNIRLCVVQLIPQLKVVANVEDKRYAIALQNVMGRIEDKEQDKDIKEIYKKKQKDVQIYLANSLKPEALTEERIKQDEENKISQGKAVVNSKIGENASLARSTPAPPKTTTRSIITPTVDPHFLIDAGIQFPIEPKISFPNNNSNIIEFINNNDTFSLVQLDENLPNLDKEVIISSETVDVNKLSESDLEKLETSTSNITDEIKVNLRSKIHKNKNHKRYSSVSGIACFQPKNIVHRRSLTLGDMSRIPVKKDTLRNSFSKERIDSLPISKVNREDDVLIEVLNKNKQICNNNKVEVSKNVEPVLSFSSKSKVPQKSSLPVLKGRPSR